MFVYTNNFRFTYNDYDEILCVCVYMLCLIDEMICVCEYNVKI